jgi:hypothetical protein
VESTEYSKSFTAKERSNRIAYLNDQLRVHGLGGKIVMTHGIANLGEEMIGSIIDAMRKFSDWSKDNDPYGEHDFGVIALTESRKVYFKIDYYDAQLEFGSEDPANSEVTTRVLTLMLAEEY